MDNDNLSLPELGIELTTDVRLAVDWSQISEGLTEAAAAIVFISWADGGATGITKIVQILNSINVERPAGQRALNLIALSSGWSIGHVISQYTITKEYVSESLNEALTSAKDELKEKIDLFGPGFLRNPLSSQFYQSFRSNITDRLMMVLAERGYSRDILIAKLDMAFLRGLYEVWSLTPTFYAELSAIIDSPFAEISEVVLGWQSYRQSLLTAFNVSPVFGQEHEGIALSQLYIPLRGYWPKKSTREGQAAEHHAGGTDTHVIMIEDEIDAWMSSESADDWLKLIGGGPGSGKSTTLKSIAAKYANDERWRPLFVPLQHIGIGGNLRDDINSYFTNKSDSPFKHDPLSRNSIESGPPLLLIFDGLDELSAPNESASEIVQSFTGKLTSLVSAIAGDKGRAVKVIVSGRLPAFQAAKRFLPLKDNSAIEAYGYSPAARAPRDDNLWAVDQRPQWWTQYTAAKGIRNDGVPEALSSDILTGISHEPLLCYLLALSNYTGDNWKEAADNTNLIYRALVASVYERGWGEGPQKRLGPGKTMTQPQFNKLMQTFGLAAWLGGDSRIASEKSFQATLQVTKGQEAWEAFKQDNGSDVNNLAMNFYLKAAEASQRGFEFTHKSFGEYLAAKAIVEFAFSMFDLVDRSIEAAIQEWFKATKTGVVTYEVLNFILNEIRLVDEGELPKLAEVKTAFEKLATFLLEEGHVPQGATNYRSLALSHNNVEICAWAILSGLAARINEIGDTFVLVNVKWPGPYELSRLLQRHATKAHFGPTAGDCMAFVNATGQYVWGANIWSANFVGSNFMGVTFESCYLIDVNFSRCNLSNGRFFSCTISSCFFDEASLDSVGIFNSSFEDCTFEKSSNEHIRADVYSLMQSETIPGYGSQNFVISPRRDERGQVISLEEAKRIAIDRIQRIDGQYTE